ncbi:MAG: hypothetical protein AAGD32_17475 [Planctomycetota bacterium]
MSHISQMTVSSQRRGWLEWLTFGLLGRTRSRVRHRRNLGSTKSQARRKAGNTMYELMKKGTASSQ